MCESLNLWCMFLHFSTWKQELFTTCSSVPALNFLNVNFLVFDPETQSFLMFDPWDSELPDVQPWDSELPDIRLRASWCSTLRLRASHLRVQVRKVISWMFSVFSLPRSSWETSESPAPPSDTNCSELLLSFQTTHFNPHSVALKSISTVRERNQWKLSTLQFVLGVCVLTASAPRTDKWSGSYSVFSLLTPGTSNSDWVLTYLAWVAQPHVW